MDNLNDMIDRYFELYDEWYDSIGDEADFISGDLEMLEEKAKEKGLSLGNLYIRYKRIR